MSVYDRVKADLDALITDHPMGEALAEVALNLAERLDSVGCLTPAPIAKELRATLVELAGGAVDVDDDLADELSAPTGDLKDP